MRLTLTPRRLAVAAVLLALLVVTGGVAVTSLRSSEPRACRATFERVRVGMSRAEVIATVGAPLTVPMATWPKPVNPHFFVRFGLPVHAPTWHTDDHLMLTVYFDKRDRVADVELIDLSPLLDRPSFLQRARRWLRL